MISATDRIVTILQENSKAADADVVRSDDGLTFGDLRTASRGELVRHATPEQWDAAVAALHEAQDDENADGHVHVEAVAEALGVNRPHPQVVLARMTGQPADAVSAPAYSELEAEIRMLRGAIAKALATSPRIGSRYVGISGMTYRSVVEFDGGDPYEILRTATATPTTEA